jgi:hypothetical protein
MDATSALSGVVIFVGAVGLSFYAITRAARAVLGERRRLEELLGRDALRARLQRGAISEEQYVQARHALGYK